MHRSSLRPCPHCGPSDRHDDLPVPIKTRFRCGLGRARATCTSTSLPAQRIAIDEPPSRTRNPQQSPPCTHVAPVASHQYHHLDLIDPDEPFTFPISWRRHHPAAQLNALIGRARARPIRPYSLSGARDSLYNTGARVSEAAQLKVSDLHVARSDSGHALVTLHGKRNKRRQCPLWPRTERVLAELVDGRAASDTVFLSRYRKPFTRFGVYRLVERCALRVPALAGRKTTPHVIRHYIECMTMSGNQATGTILIREYSFVGEHPQPITRHSLRRATGC